MRTICIAAIVICCVLALIGIAVTAYAIREAA